MTSQSSAPRWCGALLRWLAPRGQAEALEGDLEEAHAARLRRRGRAAATLLTVLETLDLARALVAERVVELFAAGPPGAGRRVHGGRGFGVSLLDVRLGVRMLVRYPGMTVLGGVAMAFAIFAGAGTYEFLTQVARPQLPLPDGDRIVGVRLWHAASGSVEEQASFDFVRWRESATAIRDFGAFRTRRWNLIVEGRPGMPEPVAEISASAFRVAAVRPALGRVLLGSDERPGAEAVLVIGHEVWQRRFDADPSAVGSTVRLGDVPHTVVGVMPEGFAFPVAHGIWKPARFDAASVAPREGPGIHIFGRLAEGVSLGQAQAELTRIGANVSSDHPATHAHMRPQVMPWARTFLSPPGSFSPTLMSMLILSSNLPLVLFLLLISGNVALLMFARAAARESELIVRSALGASRGRIIAQLFAEALVLAAVAAVVGLAAVQYGVQGLMNVVQHTAMQGEPLPFWFRARLSPESIAYAALLTVLAAAVAGGLPGFKVTRNIGTQLRSASAGGGGFRFGLLWTALIVMQIALTVMFPVFAVAIRSEGEREIASDLPIAVDDFLVAQLAMNTPDPGVHDGGEAAAITAAAQRREGHTAISRLTERLYADARVKSITFSERPPRAYHPWRQIEVDGPAAPAADERGHRIGSTRIAPNYFDALGVPMLAGRAFHRTDAEAESVVIVNESFAGDVLAGANPLGRRIRYVATEEYRNPAQEPGPWLEIVGVVPDLGTVSGYGTSGIYHPQAPSGELPTHMIVGVAGDTPAFRRELFSAATAVDPRLRIDNAMTLADVTAGSRNFYAFWFRLLLGLTAIGLLLSLGGIYAVMAFTVAQRTREIGIRVALGASRRAVLTAVFRRPMAQVVTGVAAGGALLLAMLTIAGGTFSFLRGIELLLYMTVMLAVCMLACVVPTQRALSIEPGEALRE